MLTHFLYLISSIKWEHCFKCYLSLFLYFKQKSPYLSFCCDLAPPLSTYVGCVHFYGLCLHWCSFLFLVGLWMNVTENEVKCHPKMSSRGVWVKQKALVRAELEKWWWWKYIIKDTEIHTENIISNHWEKNGSFVSVAWMDEGVNIGWFVHKEGIEINPSFPGIHHMSITIAITTATFDSSSEASQWEEWGPNAEQMGTWQQMCLQWNSI